MDNNTAKVVEFPGGAAGFGYLTMAMGRILAIEDEALVVALGSDERVVRCGVLTSPGGFPITLAANDEVLVAVPHESRIEARGVVLGRIGAYGESQPVRRVVVCATESLTLSCGEAMRARLGVQRGEALGAGEHARQRMKQHFIQRINHFSRLPNV